MTRLFACERGNSVIEFAFLGPIFLMMIFLILDGGRMLFTKQALNELAVAAARCAATHPSGCTTSDQVASWAADRGKNRARLPVSAAMVTVTMSGTCNGVAGMAQASITMPYTKSAMNLLPQSQVPSSLTSSACFLAS